jgi:hypothetical protein
MTWQRLLTNDRPTLSSERAPQEDKDHNSHHVGLKIWSWVPEGTRHQEWLTDWPSAVTWLWLWSSTFGSCALGHRCESRWLAGRHASKTFYFLGAKSTRAGRPTIISVMYYKFLNELLFTSLCWPLTNYVILNFYVLTESLSLTGIKLVTALPSKLILIS